MRRRILGLAAGLLLLWPVLTLSAQAADGEAEAMVSLVPGATEVETGETFTVTIRLTGLYDVIGADVQVTFDPSLLQVVDADPGSPGVQVTPGQLIPGLIGANQADNQAGRIRVAVAKNGAGVTGGGTLATVMFTAVAPGTAALDLLPGGVDLLDSTLASVPHRAQGAQVVVTGEPVPLPAPAEPGPESGQVPDPAIGQVPGPESGPAGAPAGDSGALDAAPLGDSVMVSVGPGGGLVQALGDEALLRFAPGALPRETEVTIGRVLDQPGIANPALVPVGGPVQVEFAVEGLPAGDGITLELRYPADLDPAMVRHLGIYRLEPGRLGEWVYVGGVINPAQESVAAQVPGPGRYGLMLYQPAFSDIQEHWAREAIELLAARRVVTGDPSGQFRPDDPVTRAEMAKLFVLALGLESGSPGSTSRPSPTFQDVPAGAWHHPYVSAAAAAQLVRGEGDRFRPEAFMTRVELTVMLVRALGLEPEARGLDPARVAARLPFADAEAIPEWAQPYVATAAFHGLLEGVWQGDFAAGQPATRAEAAALMVRAVQRLGRIEEPADLVGTLQLSTIEGRHYELETAEGRYVLLLDRGNRALADRAAGLVGRLVRVTGRRVTGVTTYQRGRALEVYRIETVGP